MDGDVPAQVGNNHPVSVPSNVFETADGFVSLAATGGMWPKFCDLMGHPEWKGDARWRTSAARSKHRDVINEMIADVTKTKTSNHWITLFERNGIPCGPIYSIDQMFSDPQVRHIGMTSKITHPLLGNCELVASPINMSGIDKGIRFSTRDAGSDTDAVLYDHGYSASEIAALREARVV